jgi:hypothetical protein
VRGARQWAGRRTPPTGAGFHPSSDNSSSLWQRHITSRNVPRFNALAHRSKLSTNPIFWAHSGVIKSPEETPLPGEVLRASVRDGRPGALHRAANKAAGRIRLHQRCANGPEFGRTAARVTRQRERQATPKGIMKQRRSMCGDTQVGLGLTSSGPNASGINA